MVVLIFLVILGLTFENLTRVTEDSLPLGNSTKTKKNFRPVLCKVGLILGKKRNLLFPPLAILELAILELALGKED